MSAEPTTLKTDAERELAAQFQTRLAELPGSPAVAERRAEHFAKFERMGLPHRRVEPWKYTDLRALMRRAEPIAPRPSDDAVEHALGASPRFGGVDRHRLVIADGHFIEALSDREALLTEGVEIATLAEFLGFDSPAILDVFNAPEGAEDDAMTALNAALASDGVVIFTGEGCAPSKPIELVHVTTAGEPRSWYARSVAQIGKDANLTLLVSHIGPDGVATQSNSFLGLHLAKGADITAVDLQAEGDKSLHIATFAATLADRATLRHVSVTGGSAVSRLQGFVSIRGEGAELGISGANMIAGTQHGDASWRIDHAAPNSTSRVLYKNASADTAFGVFQGLILVRSEAQKTDGKMMTRTLLLSEEAQFAAKPELEIYADDVQCGHGATVGQVDREGLFYLMSRGIPKAEAEALLVHAFLREAVEMAGSEQITEALAPVIASWLERRGR